MVQVGVVEDLSPYKWLDLTTTWRCQPVLSTELLDRAAAGESTVVTDHGHPVAPILPLRTSASRVKQSGEPGPFVPQSTDARCNCRYLCSTISIHGVAGGPVTPGLTAQTLPASRCWLSGSPSRSRRAVVMYKWSRSGPPKQQLVV